MTDEEWEQIRPLIEDYEEAVNDQNALAMANIKSGIRKDYSSSTKITRNAIDEDVEKLRAEVRVKVARRELEWKCYSIFRVEVSV
jgi:hypothetical protein